MLTVTKKTGFKIDDPSTPVVIMDNRGIPFFSTEALVPRCTEFNMPPFGTFKVLSGTFTPLPSPVKYAYHDLPDPQRNRKPPYDYRIVWEQNNAKCTIDWNNKKIIIDPSLKQKPLPEVFLMIYHEFAHAWYGVDILSLKAKIKLFESVGDHGSANQLREEIKQAERNCDLMAGNYMKARGFNPSQIELASYLVLSNNDPLRKKQLRDALDSVKNLN